MAKTPEVDLNSKPHPADSPSTLEVMREFASSVYDGAISDYFKSSKSKTSDADLQGSMKTAELYGKGVGKVLDAAVAVGVVMLAKKAGAFERAVAETPLIERVIATEKPIAERLLGVEFKPSTISLKNEYGSFERDLATGSMTHTATNGDVYGFPVNGFFKMGATGEAKEMYKYDHYFIKRHDGSEVIFNGLGEARRATTYHGVPHQWSFLEDGSISMKSDGGGQHTLDIGPNGRGEAVSWFSKANPKPGEFNEERVGLPVTYDPVTRKAGVYVVPDRRPMSAETKEQVERARAVLEQAAIKRVAPLLAETAN